MEIKLTLDLEFDFENSTIGTVVIKKKDDENHFLEVGALNALSKLPKSWDDIACYSLCENYKDAFRTLVKLIVLRDAYRMGWKPKKGEIRYVIELSSGNWEVGFYHNAESFLSFETKKICVLFYERFKDMLEKVKPLFC